MRIPKSTLGFIGHFVWRQKFMFLGFVLTAMVWSFNETFFPYFLKRIVNTLEHYHGDPHQAFSAVLGTLILLVIVWVATEALLRLQGILQIYTYPRFRADIREYVFNYVKSHSHEYFASNFAGNIAKKLADLPTSCHAVTEIICFQYVPAITGSIVILIMMWQTQPIFAAILITWLCFHLGLTGLFLNYGNRKWEIHSESETVLSGKIIDAFSNILNVRLFARGRYESEYLKKYQDDEIKKSQSAQWAMEFTRMGLGLNGLFLIFGMIFALVHSWSNGWITLGDFTQVGMQSFWILGWIWFVSYQMTVMAREFGTINNALTLVRKGHDLIDQPDAKPIAIKQGEIRFDHVTFCYNPPQKIFDDFNVVIPAGQKVGLVGFSGSGKTTFVNLILRFYDLQSGRILLDGQDIATVTQDSLRSQIAMIPQDPALFHRSLMENLRYGRVEASDEEVIAASKLAHCHEFIEKLDERYDSLVGERGIKLSGGQRQRIAIARAMLKNAPILILDEATSALDSVTEKLIQESLHHLMTGRTTIVVAHRLSTLANMDRILVFHQGRIVEEGTQEHLLQANGHFAKLWQMQTGGFLPDGEKKKFCIDEEE